MLEDAEYRVGLPFSVCAEALGSIAISSCTFLFAAKLYAVYEISSVSEVSQAFAILQARCMFQEMTATVAVPLSAFEAGDSHYINIP